MPDMLTLGDKLALPLDAVTRTIAIVGQKGTGKTSTGVVLLEEAAAAGARFAVMDPTGAWSGLRSSADGDGPGVDCVVMGGFHGDVPLDPSAGEVVARLVVEEGYSVVCDLERMPKSEQVLFVADFSTSASHLCRSAVTIVFDEAPRFAGQSGVEVGVKTRDDIDDGIRCRRAVTDVVMLGRRKGLGSVLISQRPSKLHKDVLEQADLLVAHRLMGVNDRKAIAGWLENAADEPDAILERIPRLERGQAVVLAPEYGTAGVFAIRPKRTFDSSATPDVGAVILDAPRGRASIDLTALEAKMGHALEAAQENDPDALKRQVQKLKQQLAEGGGADVDELAAAKTRVSELEARLQAWSELTADARAVAFAAIDGALLAFDEQVAAIEAGAAVPRRRKGADPGAANETGRVAAGAPLVDDSARSAASRAPSAKARAPHASPAPATGSEPDTAGSSSGPAAQTDQDEPTLKAGAIRMLDVLARYGPLPRRDLAVLSRVSPVSGTVSDYLSVLRRRALVTEADGHVEVTAAGVTIVHPDGKIPKTFTPEQVYGMWEGDLKAGARRMVEHLMRVHPDGFTRRELAGLAGISPQSGTVSDYMSTLRRRGLVVERSRRVYAGDVLYRGSKR